MSTASPRVARIRREARDPIASRTRPELRLVPMSVPDPTAVGLDWPELAASAERAATLARRRREHAASLEALRAVAAQASDSHRLALADSIVAGKAEPADREGLKIAAKLEEPSAEARPWTWPSAP